MTIEPLNERGDLETELRETPKENPHVDDHSDKPVLAAVGVHRHDSGVSTPDTHLGDGVYASFDGVSITLDLRGQDDTTRIVLEPDTLLALDNYRKRTWGATEEVAK